MYNFIQRRLPSSVERLSIPTLRKVLFAKNGRLQRFLRHSGHVYPTLRSSNYFFMLTILSDYRSSIIHCRSIYFCSTWKDHLSDNNFCGKMSSHLRSQKRLEFGIFNEASSSREHHFSLRMEGPAICGMGWGNSGEHGGCMGFQEGEES